MLYHDTTIRPSAAERELLQALVDEATMGAVARRIGRSERHTRRLVRTLTHRLGVDHPRAAVALAGQMGWIQVAPLVSSTPAAGSTHALVNDAAVEHLSRTTPNTNSPRETIGPVRTHKR